MIMNKLFRNETAIKSTKFSSSPAVLCFQSVAKLDKNLGRSGLIRGDEAMDFEQARVALFLQLGSPPFCEFAAKTKFHDTSF